MQVCLIRQAGAFFRIQFANLTDFGIFSHCSFNKKHTYIWIRCHGDPISQHAWAFCMIMLHHHCASFQSGSASVTGFLVVITPVARLEETIQLHHHSPEAVTSTPPPSHPEYLQPTSQNCIAVFLPLSPLTHRSTPAPPSLIGRQNVICHTTAASFWSKGIRMLDDEGDRCYTWSICQNSRWIPCMKHSLRWNTERLGKSLVAVKCVTEDYVGIFCHWRLCEQMLNRDEVSSLHLPPPLQNSYWFYPIT